MNQAEIIAMAKESGIHIDRLPDEYCTAVNLPLGSVSRWDGVGLGELQRFAALVAAKEREACDKWRQAIDHEMVVAHLGVAKPEDDPAALLRQVIQWHVDVALDPAVSGQARKLVQAEREAWRASLEPAFRGRMGSEQVREIIQSAIRARGTKEGV